MESVRVKVDIPIKDVVEYPLVLEEGHTVWSNIVHNSSEEPNGYYSVSLPANYEGMKEVRVKVNVPQTVNANVWNMKNTDEFDVEHDVYLTENRVYNINQEKPDGNYVGFNPVRVKVPNLTVTYTSNNKITESRTITLQDMKDEYEGNQEKSMIVGCREIEIDIPNKTIPYVVDPEHPENPSNVISNTPLKRTQNGTYTIGNYKFEHENDFTASQIHQLVGFSRVDVQVPNKIIYMDTTATTDAEHPYNTGTIDTNGFYDINWWKNNSHNVVDIDDYIGFDKIRVNVQPKLLENQIINVTSNNYPLNINDYWNNSHPNDKKDGFGSGNIIHYPENTSGDVELSNAVIKASNSQTNDILTTVTDNFKVMLEQVMINNTTVSQNLGKSVDGLLQVLTYNFKDFVDAQGKHSMNITNTYNAPVQQIEHKFDPVISLDKWVDRYLTNQQWNDLANQIGGTENVRLLCDALHIKGVATDEQTGNPLYLEYANDNNNNTQQQPPQSQVSQRGGEEPPLKRRRGLTPDFVVANFVNNIIYKTQDINDKYNEDYYCTWDCNCKINTEMLAYDTITITNNDNSVVEYDIVDDFIENVDKNPLINDPDDAPGTPGHPTYNPLGVRKLYINWPKSSIIPLETSDASHRIAGTVDFNNTTTGVATITALPNYGGFEAPLYLSLTGSNFPSDVDNYTGYDQNNRYTITQEGNGVISIPPGKTGLGDIYYTVNISNPPSPPLPTPNIYYTVISNNSSGNNVSITSGYNYTQELDNIGIDLNNMRNVKYAFYKINGIDSILKKVTNVINDSNIDNVNNMFIYCYSLTSVPLFNTSSVTNMSNMFKFCYSLTSVPLFNTSLVYTMNSMFYSCYSLKSVPLFNTSSVTDMGNMFDSCYSLNSVALFNTSIVTNMSYMFSACYALTSVPLFDTSSVQYMNNTFNNCQSLISVPLFDTSSVRNMSNMFSYSYSLTSVPLFNTISVTTMEMMFNHCYSLTSVPLFNTSIVTNMSYMFDNCSSLSSVPLFDTSSVQYMTNMFRNCLYLSNESLNNILMMCKNSLVVSSNKKLNTYVGINSSYNSIIQTLSNYNDFINAGWSLS